jgi:ribosomal protein L29
MKTTEIRKKDVADLKKLLEEKRKAVQNFRFGVSGSKVKNMKESMTTRRDIARILTVLGEATDAK